MLIESNYYCFKLDCLSFGEVAGNAKKKGASVSVPRRPSSFVLVIYEEQIPCCARNDNRVEMWLKNNAAQTRRALRLLHL